jgi:magnesium transporter
LHGRPTEMAEFPISYLYVVEEDNRLVGVLRIRDLLLREPHQTVGDIMIRELITVRPDANLAEVGEVFDKYHLFALPVLDDQGRMLGLIQQEDVAERIEQEASRGLLKFTGILGGEEYRDMSVGHRIRLRLPWLTVNIFLNVLAASVIVLFEETLHAVVAVAVFLPIVSDMSGCSGGQAAAVSIRELALGRLKIRKLFWVMRKELAVGLINGLALGTLVGMVALLWKGLPFFGLVVALALWINTAFSVCIGGSVPVLLKKLGIDPAIATTPILTTLTDALGFFLVMILTTLFLPYLVMP